MFANCYFWGGSPCKPSYFLLANKTNLPFESREKCAVAKRGFNNAAFADTVVIINVGQLEQAFDDGAEITVDALVGRGLVPSRHDALKVLGDGELTKKFTVNAHRFSRSAEEKIVAAGGRFERI